MPYKEEEPRCGLRGYTIVPGFVDVHVHGGAGADSSDGAAEGLRNMAKFLLTKGVTSFCPTTMTVSDAEILKALETIRSCMDDKEGAKIVGVNLEGPFISPKKKGAQGDEFIQAPDYDVFKKYYDSCGGIIKLVDIGARVRRARRFCRKSLEALHCFHCTHRNGLRRARWTQFKKGVTHATHLYNAMSGLAHRAPGVVGAVFDNENVCGELICDGIHIHPAVVRTTFKLMPERVCVISDAMRLSGVEDGGQGGWV